VSTRGSISADAAAELDRRLVRAIGLGETRALSDLYDRYARAVFGLARRILGQTDAAEEVVQDVFTQVWREAPRYDPERGAVGAWIMTLARARAIDRLRARQARPDQSRAVEDAAIRPMAAAGDSPEDVIVSSDEARRVRQALDALPEQSRALIDLAYYEGLTHSEIARRTGMPLGTVKTRLRTAMHTLREVLPV
jgi:RNA polymerase sigma-70 factor (ECF subfamily)